MGKETAISWAHHTFNPWWGCTKVSEACKHCYAERWAHRVGIDVWGTHAPRRFFGDAHWREPLHWNKHAENAGERRRVFCASMADVFELLHPEHPDTHKMTSERQRLWDIIADTPNLDWLLLTKRPENFQKLIERPLPNNVWLGVTAENQEQLAKRAPYLLRQDARIRFLSVEPMLGPLDLEPYTHGLHWVICGGESGPGARPMDHAWVEQLQNQRVSNGVDFHFKQWGEHDAKGVWVGKVKAGRTFKGRTWDAVPDVGGIIAREERIEAKEKRNGIRSNADAVIWNGRFRNLPLFPEE